MPPKTDPYATKFHRRVDALLFIFTVLVIALVLRTSARGQGNIPGLISVAPQPFWSTLSLFRAQPKVSVFLVVPSFLGQSQPDHASVNRADFSALAGFTANSKAEFSPTMVIEEKTSTHTAPAVVDSGYVSKSSGQSGSGLTNWSNAAGVGSTIPAYSTGFGAPAGNVATTANDASQSQSIAGDDARSRNKLQNGSAGASPVLTRIGKSDLLAGSDVGIRSLSIGNGISVSSAALLAGPSKADSIQRATPEALGLGPAAPDAVTPNTGDTLTWDAPTSITSWTSSGNSGVIWYDNTQGDVTNINTGTNQAKGYAFVLTGTGTNSIAPSTSMTISADLFMLSLTLQNNFNGTNTLTLGNGGSSARTVTLGRNGSTGSAVAWSITDNATSGTVTYNSNNGGSGGTTLALYTSGSVSVANGGTLALNLSIADTDATHTGGITKTGLGILLLSGANTFTGGVTINNGTLRAGSTTALGAAANATLTFGSGSTGKFQLFGFDTTVVGLNTNVITPGTPVIENGVAGTATLTDNISGSDAFNGVLQNGAAGTLAFTKAGSGTSTLRGTNTYTGDTQINAGVLRFDGGTSNSSTIRLGATSGSSNATLSLGLSSGNNLGSALEARAGTSGARVLSQLAGSGTNTYSGAITLNAGLTLESVTGGTLLLQGGSVAFGNKTLTIDTQVDQNGANSVNAQGAVTINEALTSSLVTGGSLVKDGGNTLLIQTTGNTYTGNTAAGVALNTSGTRIRGGTLAITGDTSLGIAPSVATNNIFFEASTLSSPPSTRTLQASGGNVTLAATRNISIANGVTGTFDSNGNVLTVNGAINNPVGNGNIAKIGAGTLALANANTFSGTTTIDAGTLNAAAAGALGSTSSVTVNSGGTLLLSNSGTSNRINDSAAMTLNGGTFDTAGLSEHGATNNTAGMGALTLLSSSIIDMGSGSSILAFAASLLQAGSWSGTLSIYNWSGTPITGGGIDQLFFGNNILGLAASQLLDFQFYSGAGTGAYAPGAAILATGEVVPTILVPVPEPATWLAGALALLAVGYMSRRRFQALVKAPIAA